MPELRKDPVLSRWVIISTERGNRPQFYVDEVPRQSDPADCPFCTGNEHLTPPELYSVSNRADSGKGGWSLRVVPNKFPVLRIEGSLERRGQGLYDMMNGVGAHEVVIETERHSLSPCDQTAENLKAVFTAFRQRALDLYRDQRFEYIMIFKNHGMRAGASLDHPHSQLVALPIVPKRVLEELEGAVLHWKDKKRCIFTDIIDQEKMTGERLVYSNDRIAVFCPYASLVPFETWILPKRQQPAYRQATDEDIAALADAMSVLLKKYCKALGENFDYNYIIHTIPSDAWCRENMPLAFSAYSWHIEFYPKLTKSAGFEWGTEFYINHTLPEDAAKCLREAEV